MKFKKVILCILLFFMCVTMFGCANVNLSTRITSDGVIESKLNIKIDKDSSLASAKVYPVVLEYFKQLENQYAINLVELYSNVYDFEALDTSEDKSMYDEFQEQFNYIYQQNISKYLISKEESITNECKHDSTNKIITITKKFGSIYAYLMYFYPSAFEYNAESNKVVISDSYKSMIDVPMGGGFKEDENLFITKYIQTSIPFYYNGEEPKFFEDTSYATAGQTLVSALENNTSLTEEQVKLMFNFSTPYKRVHSNGSVKLTDKGYTHTWQLSSLDDTITIWRTYANYVPWYILAGVAGILIFGIGTIIIVIINNHKKRQGMKALNKINNLMNNQDKK